MIVALVFVASFAAFIVSAVAGGGAGLVLMPLLRLIVPIAGVPAALSIGTAASSLSRIAMFRSSIRWDVVRRFVPTALPAAALGAWLLTRFPPAYVELILACFLLANLPALFRRKARPVPTPLPLDRLPLIGAVAGLLSGFTGAVGLLLNDSYARLGMDRHQVVATRATNEILLHLLKIGIYTGFGLIDHATLIAGSLVAVAAILGSVAVRWLLPLIREAVFRSIGQLAMVASGAAMFALSSTQIAAMHDAWIAAVAPDGEREVQFYWNGRRQIAAEAEPEGYLAFERRIAFADLPRSVQHAAMAHTSRATITLIEAVRTPRGRSYEIYYRRDGRDGKVEFPHPGGG